MLKTLVAALLVTLSTWAASVGAMAAGAATNTEPLRFAVGPFQPTPGDTRKAYEPFFKHIADRLGRPYELTVTTDWAGIAVALGAGTVDAAWMGPWGYVLANNQGAAQAVATVTYDGKPTYHAIIVGRPDLTIQKWPDDAKGLSISFADVGSTSGWLVPTHWFKARGIDPKAFFKYREGASHPANQIAVANGQVDLATDYDRNMRAMLDKGLIKPDQVKVVWTSDPLPNDALAVRKGLDPATVAAIRDAATSITEDQAKTLLPPHYTGWVPADHASYKVIEDAGIAVGKLKPAS
ncbi:phosphate/phosphite/phosphonate ABC transporter substrate-binding protein [Aerophototrophica crusticola]|uniref:Phosphate/phosphite/phosphonate ABC transporter substrate-binding protein n=2 Tax=Aerophototrophica crusticola TaxID=1709002 RepID=A0A858RBX3_9PROT|nr:phosphate/phosphite/phosphonate ABC transporter substrate-binding protein [Rhodospirillaceae bacterium B3]